MKSLGSKEIHNEYKVEALFSLLSWNITLYVYTEVLRQNVCRENGMGTKCLQSKCNIWPATFSLSWQCQCSPIPFQSPLITAEAISDQHEQWTDANVN